MIVVTLFTPITYIDHSEYGDLIGGLFTSFGILDESKSFFGFLYFFGYLLRVGLLLFSIFFMIRQIILLCRQNSKLSVKTYTIYQVIYVAYNVILFFNWLAYVIFNDFNEEFTYMQSYRVRNLVISIILLAFTVFHLVYLIKCKKKIANDK